MTNDDKKPIAIFYCFAMAVNVGLWLNSAYPAVISALIVWMAFMFKYDS